MQTRNIERAGGALAIIIDTENEDVEEVILSDDGTGAGIRIPAMLINKIQGQWLKDFVGQSNHTAAKQTSLKAEFKVNMGVNNEVYTELFYTASDDRSLDFIRNMAEYLEPIMDSIIFEPKFVSWSCPHCESDYKFKNCFSDGKYCAMNQYTERNIDGKEILLENVR